MTHEERAAKWLDGARPTGIMLSLAEQFREVEREARESRTIQEAADIAQWEDEKQRQVARAVAAIVKAGDALRVALKACEELFHDIRYDWSDPRNECRAGVECVERNTAAWDAATKGIQR